MLKLGAGLSFGSGMLVAFAVCGVLLGAGVYIQQTRNADQLAQLAEAVQAPGIERVAARAPDVTPAPPLDRAPEVMMQAPAFDEVRREADGVTVIAGRGLPGATVRVMQNGEEIATSTVDRAGKFATIALIPPDGRGHRLTLSQIAQGAERLSEEEVLLAPLDPVVPLPDAPVAPKALAQAPTLPKETAEQSTGGTAPTGLTAPNAASDASIDTAAQAAPAAPAAQADGTQGTADAAPLVQDETLAVNAPTPVIEGGTVIAEAVSGRNAESGPPRKPGAPAALRATAEGVELLNPKLPEVMDNVALDTISYSDEGEVQLAGRAQAEASSVRVYLDNSAKVDLPVDADGRWRGDVPNVDEGIYTLRVDEVKQDGTVSSRVETPFKREPVELLAAAAAAQDGPIKAITVQKGATLWAIARDRYGAGELYVRVFEANKDAIRDPDLIYPGQIFDLPQ
ncbi:MAG: Ig-like domain-containing protein [Pseudomonadota bacterium]